MPVHCGDCPIRALPVFRPFEVDELAFVAAAKVRERRLRAREHILEAPGDGVTLFTVFEGWAYRYKSLSPGVRQITDFLLPGDLIGLQSPLTGRMRHSIQALTDVVLCEVVVKSMGAVFEMPGLGQALVKTLLLDEDRADRRLLMLGRQRPTQRLAYLMLELRDRLAARRIGDERQCPFPLTYDQMADALGLSRAQLARSLAEIRHRRWARVTNGELLITAPEDMQRFARYEPGAELEHRALL